MRLQFFGAAGVVTGSCTMLETPQTRILVDCGMFQGDPALEAKNPTFGFDPTTIKEVFVTHAHLDHVGRLPMLIKQGYKGFFYATPPTAELARLIMEDAHEIMRYDNKINGRPMLYSERDIAAVVSRFKSVEYEEVLSLPGLTVTFHDAGHIFGSAFIEVVADGKKIVFSGDVGNVHVPILKDTVLLPKNIDVLVCESTYGDRFHENSATRDAVVETMIADALRPGGVVMIPSFSLERTQELIYELNDLIDRQHRLPNVPIFLDSPLAIDALKVYREYPEYYDANAKKYFNAGDDLFTFPGLQMTYTREESKRINQTPGTKVIIAGSGMMNGGRILHHALRYLSDARNTLLLIGYQSPGTLGRQLADGDRSVQVMGERVAVHCRVKMVGALSAHADQSKLVTWIEAAQPKRVIFNHGEKLSAAALTQKLAGINIAAETAELERDFVIS